MKGRRCGEAGFVPQIKLKPGRCRVFWFQSPLFTKYLSPSKWPMVLVRDPFVWLHLSLDLWKYCSLNLSTARNRHEKPPGELFRCWDGLQNETEFWLKKLMYDQKDTKLCWHNLLSKLWYNDQNQMSSQGRVSRLDHAVSKNRRKWALF